VPASECILLLVARLELLTLFLDQLAPVHVQLRPRHQPDRLKVFLDHVAELGDDRRHELPARLPVAAARVEYRL